MMNRLKGRNLAHPGCLTGLTLSIIIGMVLGGILASVFNISLDLILWLWLALIVLFSAIGWIWGTVLTAKYQAPPSATATNDVLSSPQSED